MKNLIAISLFALAFVSCSGSYVGTPVAKGVLGAGPSSPACVPVSDNDTRAKGITEVSFSGIEGTITGTDISVTLPPCSSVTALTPSITYIGQSIIPAVGAAQDFTHPVMYTVTLPDCSTKVYTVTVAVVTYHLRDQTPSGGWIFYINPNCAVDGWTYLETAPSNLASASGQTQIPWYNGSNTTVGTTSSNIGMGKANTLAIIANQGAGTYAASACDNLVVGSFSDWFLPSRYELGQIFDNLMLTNGGNNNLYGLGNLPGVYWSSTEFFSGNAYSWYLLAGANSNPANTIDHIDPKSAPRLVRCIRTIYNSL